MGRELRWGGEHAHMSWGGSGACIYLFNLDRLTVTGKFANSEVISGFLTVFNIKGFRRPGQIHSTLEL